MRKISKHSKIGALALSTLLPLAAQATVTWTGATDNDWFNGTNWDNSPTGVTNGDTVLISGEHTVISTANNLTPQVDLTLSGNAALHSNGAVIRLGGATITVNAGSSLGGGGFWDLDDATIHFKDGASVNMNHWEQKDDNLFSFELGAGGFSTLTPGAFRIGGGNTHNPGSIVNATYQVNMAAYTGGTGVIALVDFGSDAVGMDNTQFQTATLDVQNSGAYTANLQWNDTTEAIELNITAVPEPSSAALLGLGGVALILRRKK